MMNKLKQVNKLKECKMENQADSMANFETEISKEQQEKLCNWINNNFVESDSWYNVTSYGLKHIFAEDKDGFYVTNGCFKGAMWFMDIMPKDKFAQNHEYKIELSKGFEK